MYLGKLCFYFPLLLYVLSLHKFLAPPTNCIHRKNSSGISQHLGRDVRNILTETWSDMMIWVGLLIHNASCGLRATQPLSPKTDTTLIFFMVRTNNDHTKESL